MTLLELLVNKLPERGGWPEKAACVVQDADTQICFSAKADGLRKPGADWTGGEWNGPWINFFSNHMADDSSTSIVTREQYEAALAARKPEWDGHGLPPVGCECEFFDCEKWFKVTMMYGGSNLVVLFDHDNQIERSFSTSRIDGKFRPLRSEADKKRDEEIEAMRDVGLTLPAGIRFSLEEMSALYDYGFRRGK